MDKELCEELTKGSMTMPDGSILWWETMQNGQRVYFADLGNVDEDSNPWLVYNTVLEPFHLLTALNLEASFRYAESKTQ